MERCGPGARVRGAQGGLQHPVREAGARRGPWLGPGARLAGRHRIDAYRLGDVFQGRWAEVADIEIEPRLDLPIGVVRETDPAGPGDAFQARGDVDAVAHEIAVVLLHDVAEMDADAEFDALVLRHARVALRHRVLHFDCGAD